VAKEQATHKQVVRKSGRPEPSRHLTLCVVAGSVLFLWVAWALAGFGSIREAASYYLRGETLFVDSTRKSFGAAAPGEELPVSFRLANRGNRPIRIVGCKTYCNCMLPNDLPFTLAPHQTRDFTLSLQMPGPEYAGSRASGRLELQLILFTNNPLQSRIALSISGDVLGGSNRLNPDP
jgi:hypothetical protein